MIFAANFKTTHTRATTREYINSLSTLTKDLSDEIVVFPPFSAVDKFDCNIKIGVQNGYPIENGSFTGEIGLEQLNEFEIDTILIGHSERRHIIGESQEFIAKKYEFYKSHNFRIFYCVGEPLEIRNLGVDETLNYILKQFEGIDTTYPNLVIAYEPVWAIGTGLVATSEDIDEIHTVLKNSFKKPILYGGSVKPNNAKEILALDSVDGVLVGTGSWNVDSFYGIIKA